jgi:hypothetical protein
MHDPAEVTTFLFTDIEGSTRLREHEPERMRPALARHDALARTAVESHRGTVVKMTRDDRQRVLPSGSLREPERPVDQGSGFPTFNWRHPMHIADAGGEIVVDGRAAMD